MNKPAFEQSPVTEHARFRALSTAGQRAFLSLRRKASKLAVVSPHAVKSESARNKAGVEELIRVGLLIRDKNHGVWLVPRPEYSEEIARGFGLSATEARDMMLRLVGSRS